MNEWNNSPVSWHLKEKILNMIFWVFLVDAKETHYYHVCNVHISQYWCLCLPPEMHMYDFLRLWIVVTHICCLDIRDCDFN